MKRNPILTAFVVIGLNLLIFISITSYPFYRNAHHHWIFPVLSVIFLLEWWVTVFLERIRMEFSFLDLRAARHTVLYTMGFLLLMGIVRHHTVLTCFDRCGYKLAFTALLGGFLFFAQGKRQEKGFWNRVRSHIVGLGALVWAGYLFLQNLNLSNWTADIILVCAGLILWLGRRSKALFSIALAIPLFLIIRQVDNEWLVILSSILLIGTILFFSKNWTEPLFFDSKQPLSSISKPERKIISVQRSIIRITITVGGILILFHLLAGPMTQSLSPEERRKTLLRANAFKTKNKGGGSLSLLAQRLQQHVTVLSEDIGSRAIYNIENVKKAQDYIIQHFRKNGFLPRKHEFHVLGSPLVPNKRSFANIDVVLGDSKSKDPIWVIGAHYDTAPETPGADDNASGVAVLLELARLLKEVPLRRQVRVVAFATEEPPSFGTRNMGSAHYAKELKEQKMALKAMISLEMLGYFNDQPRSQLYPPFLHLFYPDKGTFISMVSNFKSRRVLRDVRRKWKETSSFPLETVILPGPLSTIALSDQLNFWELNFPALMISDTSFYRNPHYHQESDTSDTLDYERMADITKALAEILKT